MVVVEEVVAAGLELVEVVVAGVVVVDEQEAKSRQITSINPASEQAAHLFLYISSPFVNSTSSSQSLISKRKQAGCLLPYTCSPYYQLQLFNSFTFITT